MPLPNPTYLTNELFGWNAETKSAALLSTVTGPPEVKKMILWNYVDFTGRETFHDLIMAYANENGLTEATALSGFDALNTNTGSGAWAVVDFGGAVVGGNPTGLANDARVYTATIIVDGTNVMPITVTGSTAQTFTALIGQITSDLAAGTVGAATIVGGNIQINGNLSTGNISSVKILDGDLFASLIDFESMGQSFHGAATVADLLELNLINDRPGSPYSTILHGALNDVSEKPPVPVAPINQNRIYYNHASAAWLYLFDDSAV